MASTTPRRPSWPSAGTTTTRTPSATSTCRRHDLVRPVPDQRAGGRVDLRDHRLGLRPGVQGDRRVQLRPGQPDDDGGLLLADGPVDLRATTGAGGAARAAGLGRGRDPDAPARDPADAGPAAADPGHGDLRRVADRQGDYR